VGRPWGLGLGLGGGGAERGEGMVGQEALGKYPRLHRVKKLFEGLAYDAPACAAQNESDSDRSIQVPATQGF
jgi:hypothetical protein